MSSNHGDGDKFYVTVGNWTRDLLSARQKYELICIPSPLLTAHCHSTLNFSILFWNACISSPGPGSPPQYWGNSNIGKREKERFILLLLLCQRYNMSTWWFSLYSVRPTVHECHFLLLKNIFWIIFSLIKNYFFWLFLYG